MIMIIVINMKLSASKARGRASTRSPRPADMPARSGSVVINNNNSYY